MPKFASADLRIGDFGFLIKAHNPIELQEVFGFLRKNPSGFVLIGVDFNVNRL